MISNKNRYDLLIIGAGPAGLTASIYASRYRLSHLVIGQVPGGLALEAHKVCNFPTEEEISGLELMSKMQSSAKKLGAEIVMDGVVKVIKKGDSFEIITAAKKSYQSKTVLIATGTKHRKLGVANEDKFVGKGISYCATCDAMFYKDKVVAVVGGSDAANTASVYLADVAKKVYQIYRRDKLRGETAWVDQVLGNSKIEVIFNNNVVGLGGDGKLKQIVLEKPFNNKKELAVDGVFVEIGSSPETELWKDLGVELDKDG